jgi:hypothetical protein
MPSLSIRHLKVFGLTQSSSAAPPGPWIFPLVSLKHLADMGGHRLVQAKRRKRSTFLLGLRHIFAGEQSIEVQSPSPVPDKLPFHNILQLPHVAGPVLVHKPLQRTRRI